ncbi:ATP-dependent DNA helicase RecG [Pacificibacter marinus]|uniref:Probable DNA 3'-5' helicase RecG n=1 Tax=Pacificibacter marinus TaxID=658057 RepID=A0A1Y5TP57_9RHOB|nr:ATP-dependent DNA helicase RecG [Pacificibacter marinus]SEL25361.1 ATP-dependent DNA helicase RecG [Pacificibacter marinus]SLN64839.1 ATP-dependent DNA helicase RecG [Pacificibacter marinus]
MSASRPEILFPLFAGLETLAGVGPKTAKSLSGLSVEKPRDLLFTLPHALIDRRRIDTVQGARSGDVVTVEITVLRHLVPNRKGLPHRVFVQDQRTEFQIVFFRGASDWIEKQLPVGETLLVSGKVELYEAQIQIPHPDHILAVDRESELPHFEPVYPLTAGVTQKIMAKACADAIDKTPDFAEWIDPHLRSREGWPSFRTALLTAHNPLSIDEISPTSAAHQRLAYDEFFAHQLTLALARTSVKSKPGRASIGDGRLRAQVLKALAFKPTGAQGRAMDDIQADLASPERMNRLLMGDVGSGKTLVAFMALLIAVESGGQGVLMAPTEILARQHLADLKPLAEQAGVVLELLTGRDKGKERKAKLSALKRGDIQILVGTHAVFQEDVIFHDLRLAIVDEQHRFGVTQRMALADKGRFSDVLVMTATPIPRSLSLAQFGDMDVSILDEKPAGRMAIKTALSSTERIDDVVAHLRSAVDAGRQAYWVCPLVGESEVMDLVAAEERFKHLRAALGEGKVGLVHGQMASEEKDRTMAAFATGQLAVLVATTVIEVGVNVPNASIMVIERAEHFGLAQLHQLRGRVGRGSVASTCLLLYQAPLSETGRRRLELLRETEDGFRIAEEDLVMRGAGDLLGTAQSGVPKFRIADIETQSALMALAQNDARKFLLDDPKLKSERGQAVRVLLWLMEKDRAIRLITVG